jgi:SAM-dependent methyltransferase
MDEARKTNELRTEEFKQQYFAGRVIDIGCGPDLIVPHAVPFDLDHGDAQTILDFFEPESFDCVHSSHCLEHMRDVRAALAQWWALVRPGGYLIIVVPHEDLYEQGVWPPLFNPDHKATFNLGGQKAALPVSFDIAALVNSLNGAEIVDACVQDQGLDYRLLRRGVTRFGRWLFKSFSKRRYSFFRDLKQKGFPVRRLNETVDRIEQRLGKPIDQTMRGALAQIQVVAKKRSERAVQSAI